MAAITSILCVLCDKFAGTVYAIGEGDVTVPIRLCPKCFGDLDVIEKIPPETVKKILDELVARGIIESHSFGQ